MSLLQAKIERAVKTLSENGNTDFADNYLKDEGVTALCRAAAQVPALRSLELSGNDIRTGGSRAVSELLEASSTLQSLDLKWNYVGLGDAVARLCKALARNRSLTKLDLRNNRIGPAAGEAIGAMLASNTTLLHLDLRWNSLMDMGGRAILKGLARNQTLLSLKIAGNKIPIQTAEALQTAVDKNKSDMEIKGAMTSAQKVVAQELALRERDGWEREGQLVERLARQHVNQQEGEKKLQLVLAMQRTKAEELEQKLEASESLRANTERDLEGRLALAVKEKIQLSEHVVKQANQLGEERRALAKLNERLRATIEEKARLEEQVRLLEQLGTQKETVAREQADDLRSQLRTLHVEYERATAQFEQRSARLEQVAKHEIEMRESERDTNKRSIDELKADSARQIRRLTEKFEAELAAITEDRKKAVEARGRAEAVTTRLRKELLEEKVRNEEVHAQLEKSAQKEGDDRVKRELVAFKDRLNALETSRNEARAVAEQQAKDYKRLAQDHDAEIRLHQQKNSELTVRLGEAESAARGAKTELQLNKQKLDFQQADLQRANKLLAAREQELVEAAARHQKALQQLVSQNQSTVQSLERKLLERDSLIGKLQQQVTEFEEKRSMLLRCTAPLADAISMMSRTGASGGSMVSGESKTST